MRTVYPIGTTLYKPEECCNGACVSGYCCEGSGTLGPGEACGSNADCCSGNCHLSGVCCWNQSPPGCIM